MTSSSSAIRSSPQVGFSRPNRWMIWRRFGGNEGRPHLRDFHLQKSRNALRCHLRNVAGLTTTRALRQSKNRARATIANRNPCVVLCDFAFRSWNSASCLRRNRISASRAARGANINRKTVSNFHLTSSYNFNNPRKRTKFLRSTGQRLESIRADSRPLGQREGVTRIGSL